MVRANVQLTDEQYRELRRYAHRAGISLSEAVRRCVEEQLGVRRPARERARRVRKALEVCGRYEDPRGASRVAEEHDRYLAEAHRK